MTREIIRVAREAIRLNKLHQWTPATQLLWELHYVHNMPMELFYRLREAIDNLKERMLTK